MAAYLLPDQIVAAAAELAQRPGCRVTWLRADLPVLTVGHGRWVVAVQGNAHADEPSGPVSLLAWARRVLAEPALAAGATWHLLPCANPHGLARNAGWLGSDPPDPLLWALHAQRDPPAQDREFGYGDTPAEAAHEECGRWHQYLDALPTVDGYLSLHSMAFAGGAWFLGLFDDLARRAPLRAALLAAAAARGLPPHDEDRGGRKGFNRIGPGWCSAPTREGMHAFFAHDPAQAAELHRNSLEVVRRRHATPVCLVSELPQWWDPALADLTPVAPTRAAVDQELGTALQAVAAEWHAAGANAAEVRHLEAVGAGLLAAAAQWGAQPATRRDLAQARLTVGRARLQGLVAAWRQGHLERPAVAAAERAWRREWALRPLALATQVALQQRMVEEVVRHLDEVGR
ncbi:MAG: hypothetical protein IT204_25480 [Fimbriimonadaceae bacterium]|nr:hypothetical protein [Fimbriimonadaceae bacterium]